MSEEIRLTRDIHYFVRGKLNWGDSLRLLDEIVDSEEWLQFLEFEMYLCIQLRKPGIKGILTYKHSMISKISIDYVI